MCTTPSSASTANQVIVTGPNSRPTAAVPKRWAANSTVSTTSVTGTTQRCSAGAATSSPSTAESTLMAGVMTPSPKKMAVPKMPSSSSRARSRGRCFTACDASASIAMRPPSP